eukprot:353005-Chlamydomonas_euryale.AAC.5
MGLQSRPLLHPLMVLCYFRPNSSKERSPGSNRRLGADIGGLWAFHSCGRHSCPPAGERIHCSGSLKAVVSQPLGGLERSRLLSESKLPLLGIQLTMPRRAPGTSALLTQNLFISREFYASNEPAALRGRFLALTSTNARTHGRVLSRT